MFRRIFKSPWLSLCVGGVLVVASVGELVHAFHEDVLMDWSSGHTLGIYAVWHVLRAVASIFDSLDKVVR